MIRLAINKDLKTAVSHLVLGCVSACVSVEKHNEALWREIDQRLAHLTATIKPEQINTVPQIAAMRSAYKAWAKILHAIADRRKRCCVACYQAKACTR